MLFFQIVCKGERLNRKKIVDSEVFFWRLFNQYCKVWGWVSYLNFFYLRKVISCGWRVQNSVIQGCVVINRFFFGVFFDKGYFGLCVCGVFLYLFWIRFLWRRGRGGGELIVFGEFFGFCGVSSCCCWFVYILGQGVGIFF